MQGSQALIPCDTPEVTVYTPHPSVANRARPRYSTRQKLNLIRVGNVAPKS